MSYLIGSPADRFSRDDTDIQVDISNEMQYKTNMDK